MGHHITVPYVYEDEGKTWTDPQVFATNKGSRLSYPHVFEVEPGKLWITTMQGLLRVELPEAELVGNYTGLSFWFAPRGDGGTMTRPGMLCFAVVASLGLVAPVPAQDAPALPGLVAICPGAWVDDMRPWVEARAQSFDARCVAVEDVLAREEGADAPERIKRYLHREWRDNRLQLALLVGDADTFPVRWMVLDRNTPEAFDYAFYASDLYYADLAKDDGGFEDWNARKDGFHARYFGEVRGEHFKEPPINFDAISYVPEIGVGRWPVSTEDDLRAVIAKTLEWERTRRAGPPKALMLHPDGWVDMRERLSAQSGNLGKAGWAVEQQFYGGEAKQPTPATTVASILGGKELILHAGHGNSDVWDGCLGPRERDALVAAAPAIFFSVGCGTAHFATEPPYGAYLDADGILHRGTVDGEVFTSEPPAPAALQPGRLNSTGLGERLLRLPRSGAVAYIGCNTGAQPCAMTLLDGFLQSVSTAGPTVGSAWKDALAYYWQAEKLDELTPTEDWYPPSIFFQGMKFMLFGDPAVSIPRADEK